MKKNRIFSFLLAIFILGCCAIPVLGVEGSDVASSHGLHATQPLAGSEQLLDTAKAVIAYELNTETMLYAWNPDQRIDPSGIVKILTALLVLEKGNMQDMVTVYRKTLDTIEWGSVSAGLIAGEEVLLRDLLLCVMVASANDAAAVLAAHIAGDQKTFVEMMNEKAEQLGCKNSHFTNVHGLPDAQQYSTARDLAIITAAALENETFAEMFALDNFSMPATNLSPGRYFVTTNYMMSEEYVSQYFDSRVTGGKPAAASSEDRSMVCTAEVGNSRYLLVVMSAHSLVSENGLSVISFGNFVETKKLMNFAFNGFTVRQVLGKSQALCQYAVKNGSNDVVLCPEEDVWVLLPAEYNKDLVQQHNIVEASALQAPISVSDSLGVLQIRYGNLILANCDLLAMNPVEKRIDALESAERIPVELGNNAHKWEKLLPVLGVVAIGLALVAVVVLLIVKLLRNLRIRRQMSYRIRKRKRGR